MIIHTDFFVRSMDASLEFYCSKLGFSVCEDACLSGPMVRHLSNDMYNAMRLVLVRVSEVGAMIELVEFHPETALKPDAHVSPLPVGFLSILVPDIQARLKYLLERGIRPHREIFTITLPVSGTFKVAFCRDPDGNRLEFVEAQI